jgi:hypothetical protein
VQPDIARLEAALSATADELVSGRLGRGHDDGDANGGQAWETLLARVCATATAEVPGAAYAGMTMRAPHGGLTSHGTTDPAIAELDAAQATLREGPCVDAMSATTGEVVITEDLRREAHRWPRFAERAAASGIVGVLSIALAPREAPPGAMNFYATAPAAFDPAAQAVAGAFAMQAAIAVYGARRISELERGLASRDMIGQAKGILMERFTLNAAQAFDLLVRSSQDTNIKLVEVARWLTGEAAQRADRAPGKAAARPRPRGTEVVGTERPAAGGRRRAGRVWTDD